MWRDSALYPKFFFIDARSTLALMVFFLHISWLTFYIAIIGIIFFWVIERRGYTPTIFFLVFRNNITRNNRTLTDAITLRRRCQI